MRRGFFACNIESKSFYQIDFDDIVEHLWRARCRHGRLPLKHILFVEDLTHVTGCLAGDHQAWADLHERYERPLIRQCLSRIEESEAIVFVRRYLRQLQQRSLAGTSRELDEYIGDRPLRVWLGEMIADVLTGGVAVHRTRRTSLRWPRRSAQDSLFALAYPQGEAPTLPFPTIDPTRNEDDSRYQAIPSPE
ncbi:MAG: hypothetical protein O7G85_03440 [Planctomycetota bacterium]|nr:hypothetical protein [Planctomycetota bacterium]